MLQTAFKSIFRLREKAARRPGADDGFDAYEKPFLDHLEDLRHTIGRIGLTLVISTVICFIFNKQIFHFVQIPANSPLAEIAPGVSLGEKLELMPLAPTEMIFVMFKLAFYTGVIITFPFTVFFLFQFLLPGLRQAEKKAIIPGVAVGFVLFLVGGGFAFLVATPLALKYFYVFENERLSSDDPIRDALGRPMEEVALIGFDGSRIAPVKEGDPPLTTAADPDSPLTPELRTALREYLRQSLATTEGANFTFRFDEARDKLVLVPAKGGKSSYQIGKYISFISQLVLVFGISFQMPIVVTILVKLDLLTARVMRSTRSYAWVIIVVVAAILTPSPDAFTMGLLAVPLILLYEICIVIASILERARERRERAEEEAERSRLEQLYLRPASELTEEEKAELHRAEIEQYEREHAHLYQDESEHVARDGLHGDQSINHDESWHDDDHYWHEDPHHGMESDHAEPEDLEPGDSTGADSGGGDSSNEEATGGSPGGDAGEKVEGNGEPDGPPQPRLNEWGEYENCAPEGPVVDLNHATLEELQTLPGVGPKLAETIVEHRPYETFDDLDRVPGLGPEKIRRITERIMLG